MTEIITTLSLLGFISVTYLNLFFPMSIKSNGWRLVYTCAIMGVINIFICSVFLKISYVSIFYQNLYNLFFKDFIFSLGLTGELNKITPLAFLNSVTLLPQAWGRFYLKFFQGKSRSINANFKDLFEFHETDQVVYLSLVDGKVYVGTILDYQLDKEDIHNRYIQIVPYFSGFRRKDNHDVYIKNNYLKLKDELGDDFSLTSIPITIPQNQVSRYSKFDFDAAKNFKLL